MKLFVSHDTIVFTWISDEFFICLLEVAEYVQELYGQGIQYIIVYSIAFEGKNVEVVSCTLENPQMSC